MSCAIYKGGFFEIAFVVVVFDTHLPRFEALAYVLPHFDALTHVVIRVSSAFIFQTFAEVCYSVFVNRSSFKSVLNLRKAYIFKSFLKVYYRSVFAESFKTFIFQKFRRPLYHKVIKSTELCSSAAVVPQSKSTEMWSSAAPFSSWLVIFSAPDKRTF